MNRSRLQAAVDFVTFPIRAMILFEKDAWGLSSLASERFDYVAREVNGRCLDVGCGPGNRFVREYLGGNGVGVDVYAYEGLSEENLLSDARRFPFPDADFDAVTFIANLNHVPREDRDAEISEAWRCLRPGGKIIITMGDPWAEILVHRLVLFYEKFLGADFEMDTQRGMHAEEDFYVPDAEIRERLARAGFAGILKKRFPTQWGLNHMLMGWKP